MMKWYLGIGLLAGFCLAAAEPVEVTLDVTEAPHLKEWGLKAQALLTAWHPRICNLLPTQGFEAPRKLSLKIKKADKGVAATAGTRITVNSGWIERHPKDFGAAIHELVHVIQRYQGHGPGWITEGVADYARWAIFEGKAREAFPRPKKDQGYKAGYQVAAGFLLWLESGRAPGIVNKLNTAMRKKSYSAEVFRTETGNSLDELWHAYVHDS